MIVLAQMKVAREGGNESSRNPIKVPYTEISPNPPNGSTVNSVFQAVIPVRLQINTKTAPRSEVEKTLIADSGKSRIVLLLS
jgi:hypothetical protein